jgi:hypothetical protein
MRRNLPTLRWTTTLSHTRMGRRKTCALPSTRPASRFGPGMSITTKLTMDEPGYRPWGVPISEFVTFDDLSSHIHPADRVRAAFAATRVISGAYEIDSAFMVEDPVCFLARGHGEDVGMGPRQVRPDDAFRADGAA